MTIFDQHQFLYFRASTSASRDCAYSIRSIEHPNTSMPVPVFPHHDSLTSTYRYRALLATISRTAWFAPSFIDRSSTHGFTSFSAASFSTSSTSRGGPMSDPLTVLFPGHSAVSGNCGSGPSGMPTWMNFPNWRSSCKYPAMGISGDETVETMTSIDCALLLCQSLSSSVAMKASAPSFSASSFLDEVREMATMRL